MQKIELTPNTLGTVMDRLQRATSGKFSWEWHNNQKPLQVKKKDYQRSVAEAKVSIHLNYQGEEKLNPIKHKTCLLHLFVSATSAMYYTFGDVFYFKGKQVIIDRKGQYDINCITKSTTYRSVEVISIITYKNHLSYSDKNQAAKERLQAQRDADEYEKYYFDSLFKDNDFDLVDEDEDDIDDYLNADVWDR